MCDEQSSSTQIESDRADAQLSLLDLPVEIFLHICSFLDGPTLVHSLGLVCKQFHQILNSDSLWKARIRQIWPDTSYPVLPPAEDNELFWKLSCVAIERQTSLWRKRDSLEKVSLINDQYSTVDGVILMEHGNICISGARDRSLACWNLTEKDTPIKPTCIKSAHDGWIWDLATMHGQVYSCSWDRTVKSWMLTIFGLLHQKTYEIYRFMPIGSAALLCIATCPELKLFATGSFCKTVLVFDSRTGDDPIVRYQPHSSAVIRMSMSSDFILSASDDRTVAIWDQRAGKTMKNVTISKESFPMSICMQRDVVYVGDSSAKLHVLDPKRDFEPVKCYTTEHTKGITGVHLAPGCLITSSMDKTVRISSPTDPPKHLTTLYSEYGEIARIDYQEEVLVISGTAGIEVWRPKLRYR